VGSESFLFCSIASHEANFLRRFFVSMKGIVRNFYRHASNGRLTTAVDKSGNY
jgi:hypothetical protein